MTKTRSKRGSKPHPHSPTTTPTGLCPHFGECGGCFSQDVPYAEQLACKQTELRSLFGQFWEGPIPITPSPEVWYYRNKVELNFGGKIYPEPPPKGFLRETVLGFKRRNKWYWTLDLDECRIASPELASLLSAVRRWYRNRSLRPYDNRRGEGLLRHLVVREGKRTGQRMVVLITADAPIDAPSFVEAVTSAYPASSIYHGIHRRPADRAAADELELLWGDAHIEEHLRIGQDEPKRELRFRISPFGFFQTNTLGTEVLYTKIRRWVEARSPGVLYDLYGGSGGIALSCADRVEHVHSVESWAPASHDGEVNASANGISNVDFTVEPVEHYLARLELVTMKADCAVVLDPPRAGLHPRVVRRLIELRPPEILYVSCKPSVLAKELEALSEAYRLTGLDAVDLFPHTPHVEALASLSRR